MKPVLVAAVAAAAVRSWAGSWLSSWHCGHSDRSSSRAECPLRIHAAWSRGTPRGGVDTSTRLKVPLDLGLDMIVVRS